MWLSGTYQGGAFWTPGSGAPWVYILSLIVYIIQYILLQRLARLKVHMVSPCIIAHRFIYADIFFCSGSRFTWTSSWVNTMLLPINICPSQGNSPVKIYCPLNPVNFSKPFECPNCLYDSDVKKHVHIHFQNTHSKLLLFLHRAHIVTPYKIQHFHPSQDVNIIHAPSFLCSKFLIPQSNVQNVHWIMQPPATYTVMSKTVIKVMISASWRSKNDVIVCCNLLRF